MLHDQKTGLYKEYIEIPPVFIFPNKLDTVYENGGLHSILFFFFLIGDWPAVTDYTDHIQSIKRRCQCKNGVVNTAGTPSAETVLGHHRAHRSYFIFHGILIFTSCWD